MAMRFIMTTSACEQPRSGDIRQSRGQQRGIVQRLAPPQAHAFLLGELLETDVDIVENFHMIAKKSYGLNKDTT